MKVQLSLDDRLVERADAFADENYMSRSAFFTACATQYLAQYEAVALVKKLSAVLDKFESTGELDEEARKQLTDFQTLARIVAIGK